MRARSVSFNRAYSGAADSGSRVAVGAVISACYDKMKWSLNTLINPTNEDFLISIKEESLIFSRASAQRLRRQRHRNRAAHPERMYTFHTQHS
jgi:hypothetical protein